LNPPPDIRMFRQPRAIRPDEGAIDSREAWKATRP
jgi:hypothetical protein